MKFLKRYNNKDKSSFTMIVKVELTGDVIDLSAVLFYPECQNGGEKEIMGNLIKDGWATWGKVTIKKKIRPVIYIEGIGLRELVDKLIFLDAYWKNLNFWTQKDPNQDIPFCVNFFLFLIDRLTHVLGNNIRQPREGDIFSFLENYGFKESKNQGMW